MTLIRIGLYFNMKAFKCIDCKQTKPIQKEGGTGYATLKNNHKVCYACVAERDKKDMIQTGRAILYLSEVKEPKFGGVNNVTGGRHWKISNWPGTLSFPAYVSTGRHNIARTRYDARFTGPDGKKWWGVQYGENTQIIRCKRLKG